MESFREEYELIAKHTSEMVCLHDGDHSIRFATASTSQILGYGPEYLIGRKLTDFLSENFIEEMDFSTLMRFFDHPGARIRYQIQHRDGRLRWLETNFSKLNNSDKQFSSISTTRDISDSVQLTEDLMDAFSKEQEISKFKTNLYSIASHEFKTPLAVIQANIEMLKLKQSPKLLENGLRAMEEEVDRLNTMISDMLELRKMSLGQRSFYAEPSSLLELTQEVAAEFTGKSGLQKQPKISIECIGIERPISFDYSLMRYVLVNLMGNAIKYSPKPAQVSVVLSFKPDYVKIAISDRGIGIPKEEQVKIFQSFYRAKNAGSVYGTGVGLSIAAEFIKLHDGSISLESEVGQGSTFTISLPKKKAS